MGSAVGLRDDGRALRGMARVSRDAVQTRRLLALAAIYDESRCGVAAETAGVTL